MTSIFHAALAAIVIILALPARADTAASTCEVYHNGEHKKQRSGDCSFSQRQGFIGITLKDGVRFDLKPKEHMEYEDGDGHKVHRTVDDNGQNTFKWHDRKIVLTFGRPSANQQAGNDNANMAQRCRHKAANHFNHDVASILVQQPIREGSQYAVFGQFPRSGPDPTVFICTFNAQNELMGIKKS